MSYVCNANEVIIWNYFKSKKLNDYGIAGLIGNLECESVLNPKNLQNTGNKKLGMTDDEYVSAVDNGSYTNFAKDSQGFGLAQWTYASRKEALYKFAKSQNKSIGDLEMQLDFLYKELSESYKSVLNILKTATSVLQASNAVLLKYEKPADQSTAAQNRRASYGQKYYDKFINLNQTMEFGGDSMKIKVDELIALFNKMYKEHWSYVWGSAENGCVDCSGAFVYAYKKLNGAYIYHGSNRIARKYVGALQPISAAKPGWAAFKWKKDGAPDEYTDGKGNYYHIGLIDDTGKYVLNAKSTSEGFCRDPLSGWHYVAPLNEVDYNKIIKEDINESVLYQAVVVTQSGSLNLRSSPNGTRLGTIPRGAIVDVLNDDNNEWWKIRYNNNIGYSSTEYLVKNTTEDISGSNKDGYFNSFSIGDKVRLIKGATYTSGNNIPSWVFEKTLYVRRLNGDNVTISTLKTGDITGTVPIKYLIKQNSIDNKFVPYNVRINVNSLNIRKGAGINYGTNGRILDRGVYTIIEEMDGKGATKWLKLANGKGWISSDFTEKI